jgi:Domain of unknown function (DUF4430)
MTRLGPALLLLAVLALAGCGIGTGAPATSTRLLVSENFGAITDSELDGPKTAGSDTVLRLLQRNAKVTTRFGGGFVQSIDGKSGGRRGGRPYDWFFYVNGVESEQGGGSVKVRAGDRIWWDRHDWGATQTIPAVVGSFPEPFLHGYDGRRLPTRLECTEPRSAGCERVGKRLGEVGVVAGRGGLQTSLSKETNRVIVGLWPQIRNDDTLRNLENGPRASGVYARPDKDGRTIAVLDPAGHVARTLGPGSGLIAATRFEGGRPVWLVTGTDRAGLLTAADALQEGDLGGHFALAVSDGQAVDVPLVKRGPPGAAK